MSNGTIIPPGATSPESSSGLHEFIGEYKKFLLKHVNDVSSGESMLQLGAKTNIIQQIETWMTNPLDVLLNAHTSVENSIKDIVEQLIAFYLKSSIEKHAIKSAFEISSLNNTLSYGIVLNDDSIENREEILKFLSLYYTFALAEKIPVFFQFVPEELKSAFGEVENIS
jgi:hypothetical protein